MNLYENIIFYLITSFLGVSLFNYVSFKMNKLMELTESQKEILEKQLAIYKDLYLNVVKDPFGTNIEIGPCDIYLKKFCVSFEKSDDLFLFLFPNFISQLGEYNKIQSADDSKKLISIRYDLKETITKDFNTIRNKLGYSNEVKIRIKIYTCIAISISLFIWISYIFILNLFNPNKFSKETWNIYESYCTYGILIIMFCVLYINNYKTLIFKKKTTRNKKPH